MTRRLWGALGGTLFEEHTVVSPGANRGVRRLDGLVILEGPHEIATRDGSPVIAERDVVAIQTKASRLGMSVLGQALFSAELLRGAGAGRVRTIALCTADAEVLRPLANKYGIEVVVDAGDGPHWITPAVA